MNISKEDYELLNSLVNNPNKCLALSSPVSQEEAAQMMRLLSYRYIELTGAFGEKALYRITELGKEALRSLEANAEKETVDELNADKYPALFENKVTGVIVLAINPTCGTIVKEATVEFEIGQYPLYVGTFQTCFQPFFDKTVWQRVDSVTINL